MGDRRQFILLDKGPDFAVGVPIRVYCMIEVWDKILYLVEEADVYRDQKGTFCKHYATNSGRGSSHRALWYEEEVYAREGTSLRPGLIWISIRAPGRLSPEELANTGTIDMATAEDLTNEQVLATLEEVEP
jgi:hypothetical protein